MGCGAGDISAWCVREYVDKVFIGSDISSTGISLASTAYSAIPNLSFCVDDMTASHLKTESVEGDISVSVLEHMLGYQQGLVDCYRLLKPGGQFLIRVANAGRTGTTMGAFLRDLGNYCFRRHKARYPEPTFDLTGADTKEKTAQHQKNFDIVEIPSTVLLTDLKLCGFKIKRFSTNKRALLSKDMDCSGSWFIKKMIDLLV